MKCVCGRFPDLPLVAFAIPEDAIHPKSRLPMTHLRFEIFSIRADIGPHRRTHREREPQPQRATTAVNPRSPAIDMGLQSGTSVAISLEFFPWDIPCLGEGSIEDLACVPFGNNQSVPFTPLRFLRIMPHSIEEECCHEIGRRK